MNTIHNCWCINAGIILGMHPANGRPHYNVTYSLIGWAHSQNDPCNDKRRTWVTLWDLEDTDGVIIDCIVSWLGNTHIRVKWPIKLLLEWVVICHKNNNTRNYLSMAWLRDSDRFWRVLLSPCRRARAKQEVKSGGIWRTVRTRERERD